MSKLPWLKFDLDDWNNDPELQQCSLSSQAVLIKLMGVMSRSKTVGNLEINGSYPSLKTLSRAVKVHHKTLKTSLKELQENGVLKNDGLIWYSARMRSDWEKYEKSKADGSRGGNPSLVKGGVVKPVKAELELEEELEEEEEGQPLSPEIKELTELLRSLILQRKPDRKLATSWDKNTASAIDRMIRIDGRDLEQVGRVIKWSQGNDFWWKNILSGEKLREKFDQLEADMGVESKPKPQAPLDADGNPLAEVDGKLISMKEFDTGKRTGEIVLKGDKWIRKEA